MKRLLSAVLASLLAVSTLASCGDEQKSGGSQSINSQQPTVSEVSDTEENDVSEPEGEKEMLDQNIIKSTIASTDDGNGNYTNPVIFADVPDIDFIRVDDAYYMVSTTMHLSPGCPIMKSYDLVNWEIVNYVFNTIDDTDALALRNGQNNYGKGQWASSIRYHDGLFYVGFVSYTTGKTYIYYTDDIENGKWDRYEFNEGFHDMSLLFDDDGKVYMIYGGGQIWCVELESDLSAIKPDTKRVIIDDAGLVEGCLAEGSHAYKLNGYYYIFIITWPPEGRRTQLCYRSKSLDGDWEMKVILDDNLEFRNDGVAQGGIIDDVNGNWYCLLFQDHGAVGRAPVLMTMTWEDDWPVVGVDGKAPLTAKIPLEGVGKKSIITSDEFINSEIVRPYVNMPENPDEPGENDYNGSNLLPEWQWNHNPDNRLWSLTEREGYLRLKTGDIVKTVTEARNTLTQRTFGPECSGYIKLDTANMKDGDVAGLAAFAEKYGFVGVKAENGKKFLAMVKYEDNEIFKREFEVRRVPLEQDEVYLRVDFDFTNATDRAYFYYSLDGETWTKIGDNLQMNYYGTHFMGYRFGIFNFAKQQSGGYVDVDFFRVGNEIIR